jgi:hypothetical protein
MQSASFARLGNPLNVIRAEIRAFCGSLSRDHGYTSTTGATEGTAS